MIFDIPIENTGDILNLSLAGGFLIITFFLVLVLIRAFRFLGTVQDVAENISEIVELVSDYLWKPFNSFAKIIQKIKSFFKK